MGRRISSSATGLPSNKIVQTTEGGTSGTTASQALNNLNAVPATALGIANGLIKANASGKIDSARLPAGYGNAYSGPMIEGVDTLAVGATTQFVISDYDVFTTYVVTALSGNVVRNNNIITYTAPGVVGTSGFTINDKTFPITIYQTATVQKPTIIYPLNETYGVRGNIDVQTSDFVVGSGSTTHEGSDWQLATDAAFNNIVSQLTNDSVSKTLWAVTLPTSEEDYFIRVRHKGAGAYGYSQWSDIVHIKTTLNSIVNRPTIDPFQFTIQNLLDGIVDVASSAFSLSSGSETHQGSDWQLALDSNFEVVVQQVINSTTEKTNKTFYNLTNNVTYFVRVRHKGSVSGYSEWSDAETFTIA